MKFAVKLTIIFSSIVILSIIAISYLVYSAASERLTLVTTDSLNDNAFHTLSKIDRMIAERISDMQLLSKDTVFVSKGAAKARLNETLQRFKDKGTGYNSVSFFNMDRVRIAGIDNYKTGTRHAFTEYWPGIAAGKDMVIDYSLSTSEKVPVIHLAAVVRDKSRPVGVLVLRVNGSILDSVMDEFYSDTTVEGESVKDKDIDIDLVDKDGKLLYSNHYADRLFKSKSIYWDGLKSAVSTGKKFGNANVSGPSGSRLCVFVKEKGFRDFKGSGWTLIAAVPQKVVIAPVVSLKNEILTVMLAECVLSILLIYILSRIVMRPVHDLTQATDEVSKGVFDTKVAVRSDDEIGRLSAIFNKMTDELTRNRADLVLANIYTENIINSMKNMLFVLTPQCVIKKVNHTTAEMLGYTEGELLGLDFMAFNKWDGRHDNWFNDLIEKGFLVNTETTFTAKDGSAIPVLFSGAVMRDSAGTVSAVVCVGQNISKLKLVEKELEQLLVEKERLYVETKALSLRDSLTGLANRRLMEVELKNYIAISQRYDRDITVMMIDIDYFKNYNDANGHVAGDELLRGIADIFTATTRDVDLVVRYGGEEFIIILPEMCLNDALVVAERVRRMVEEMTDCTISIGCAPFDASVENMEELIERADKALYAAKRGGRNRVCRYEPDIY